MLLAWLSALVSLALASSVAGAATQQASSSGSAIAFVIRIPGSEELTEGAVSGPPRAFDAIEAYGYPADAPVVSALAAATEVKRGAGANTSIHASATVEDASLFDGLIVMEKIVLAAHATATGAGIAGGFGGSSVGKLVVEGEPVTAAPNTRIELGDWGYAVVLEQAVLPPDAAADGYRGFVTGLHVYLTAAHAGLPAGTEILVGYTESALRFKQPASVQPPPSKATSPEPRGGALPLSGKGDGPPAVVQNPPPGVRPSITGRGYVFPVYGNASFSNDFGAFRATTGWHHGNDIFAPLGAPVLAVSSGAVYSVGWNPVGGWRLWLRDTQGNEYYYAHLSAYSPLARNGAIVRAGDVLGFVGDTGDARGTPYHLHFEIHPTALLGLGYDGVINPYDYLRAWQEHADAGAISGVPAGVAPAPGAVLVGVQDISTASGLDPGSFLERLGLAGAEGGFSLGSDPRSVIGAPAGFG